MLTKDRTRLIALWGALIGVVIVCGCGQQNSAGKAPPGPPEVAVVTIQPQQVTITTELSGRTSASLLAEVRPQVNGIIKQRLFTEGSDVKAGQVLFRIDPAPYQASLDNARAALGRSEANFSAVSSRANRMKELVTEKAVSQQDYDDAAAAKKQTEADIRYWKAAVETARINLRYTTITAPISGRIGKSFFTVGALVTAHQVLPLATIKSMDPIFIDVPQSTTDLLRLRRHIEEGRLNSKGKTRDKVTLFLEDNSKYPLEGELQFRDVTVDPTTGSVILRVIVPNPKGTLLPGMFVRAILEEGVNTQAILVPQQAVMRDPKGNPFIFTVDKQGEVQPRPLVLDRALGDKWLVVSGLASGDQVIVEGIQKARPGSKVKAIPFVSGNEKQEAAPSQATSSALGNQKPGGEQKQPTLPQATSNAPGNTNTSGEQKKAPQPSAKSK
jgi:membrane fusion protein, multidrug efflux system